jgi:hypothetical protein
MRMRSPARRGLPFFLCIGAGGVIVDDAPAVGGESEHQGEKTVGLNFVGNEGEFPATKYHCGSGGEDVDGDDVEFEPPHLFWRIVVLLITSEGLGPSLGDRAAGSEAQCVAFEITAHEPGNIADVPVGLLPQHDFADGKLGGARGRCGVGVSSRSGGRGDESEREGPEKDEWAKHDFGLGLGVKFEGGDEFVDEGIHFVHNPAVGTDWLGAFFSLQVLGGADCGACEQSLF